MPPSLHRFLTPASHPEFSTNFLHMKILLDQCVNPSLSSSLVYGHSCKQISTDCYATAHYWAGGVLGSACLSVIKKLVVTVTPEYRKGSHTNWMEILSIAVKILAFKDQSPHMTK